MAPFLAAAALIGSPAAQAATADAASAEAGTPVDMDAPDVAIDSAESEAGVAAADATARTVAQATPGLAGRVAPAVAADTQFRSLFSAWRQLDRQQAASISIPSRRPVDAMALTSSFGTRSDPFNGRRARHNGIDIPGPIGTPIYATADGMVGRAQWLGGYGNYAEIEHGNGIETRYGHMSRLNVTPGQRIRRGDIVGYMGSTGRSTGSHLHYEVRIAGAPVDPTPFVTDNSVMADASGHGRVALGGPRE